MLLFEPHANNVMVDAWAMTFFFFFKQMVIVAMKLKDAYSLEGKL